MPYKDKKKQRLAVRLGVRKHAKRKKESIDLLKRKYPDIYKAVFGEDKRKKKRT